MRLPIAPLAVAAALFLPACGKAKSRKAAAAAAHKLTECPPTGKMKLQKEMVTRDVETSIEKGAFIMKEDGATLILNGRQQSWSDDRNVTYAGGCTNNTVVVHVAKNQSWVTFTYSWNEKGQMTVDTKSNDRAFPNKVETWDPAK